MSGLIFEWDSAKAGNNLRKHRVRFEEAVSVFADRLASVHDDPDHSTVERRELIVGQSAQGRLLVVAFADRGEAIRIISARAASARERRDYEGREEEVREMRSEYRFDYTQSKENRFAERMAAGSIAVVLDPDVASVFRTSEAVNALLRSVIAALPAAKRAKPLRPKSAGRAKSKRISG